MAGVQTRFDPVHQYTGKKGMSALSCKRQLNLQALRSDKLIVPMNYQACARTLGCGV